MNHREVIDRIRTLKLSDGIPLCYRSVILTDRARIYIKVGDNAEALLQIYKSPNNATLVMLSVHDDNMYDSRLYQVREPEIVLRLVKKLVEKGLAVSNLYEIISELENKEEVERVKDIDFAKYPITVSDIKAATTCKPSTSREDYAIGYNILPVPATI